MSSPSRIPDVIDALVTLTEGVVDTDEVAVCDGPDDDEGTNQQTICIGWDGDPDSDAESANDDQDWAGLGARAKDEVIVITCAAIAWSGNGTIKRQRDRAYALIGAVADALRANPSLGFPPPTVFALRTGNLFEQQAVHGPQARVVFHIRVETRI